MKLTIDFETRSTVDLKKHGMHVYSEHPSTDILCLACKWPGCDPWVVTPHEPEKLQATFNAMKQATIIEAHNAGFEYVIWMNVGQKRYGWPPLDVSKLRCSAAKAAMHALPRSLDGVCKALGLPIQKDLQGYQLMMRMCKPRRPRVGEDPSKVYWNEDPEMLKRLMEYCAQDTRAEEAVSDALSDLPESELVTWQLDQVINNRGVYADLEGARKMIEMVEAHSGRLLARLGKLTMGSVKTAKQIDALLVYLRGLGCDLPDLAAETIADALKKEWPPVVVKEILEIRKSLARSSAAKYTSILQRASGDCRLRGMTLYHGAGTGRWSGAGVQPQNFPSRLKISADPEEMLRMIKLGGLAAYDLLYPDDPMTAAGAITRSVLTAAPGKDLVVADYSAIEGRGLAWAAGEEMELAVYRSEKDPYIASASAILAVPYDKVTSVQRANPGKVSVLACIAEGSLVLTDLGLVPIEKVSPCMRVWDGIAWVRHGGAVYKGVREVIEYDGLQATPDHVVFTQEGDEIGLREAARRQQRLVSTGLGGAPLRYGGCNFRRNTDGGSESTADPMPMLGLQHCQTDQYGESLVGEDGGVPTMQSVACNAGVASETTGGCAEPLQESVASGVSELRGEGNRVSVPESHRCGALGASESRTSEGAGDRQDQQQRTLRTGEPAMGDAISEREQYPEDGGYDSHVPQIQRDVPGGSVRGPHTPAAHIAGVVDGRDREALGDPELQTKRRVWDILSAGPRNRFTVSGKLVHNCGYGGSAGAVRKFGGHLLVEEAIRKANPLLAGTALEEAVNEEVISTIVRPWRDAHPMTVKFWYDLEEACSNAVKFPGKVFTCRGFAYKVNGKFLCCRLPSNRLLYYYDPIIQPVKTGWGGIKDAVTYMTVDSMTKKWIRVGTYSGKLAENVTQAICRDILRDAMIRLEKDGYPIVMHVHDEIISEVDKGFGSVEEFTQIMCQVPAWAKGFPISAAGWRGERYKK